MAEQQIYGDRYFDPNDPKNQLPPKKKTEGEKLRESGEYLQDPDNPHENPALNPDVTVEEATKNFGIRYGFYQQETREE